MDEEVIKRKLLMDGDGMGDDKRLMSMMRHFMKWCQVPNESVAESKLMEETILLQLSQCEYVFEKSNKVAEKCKVEIENYNRLNDRIDDEIEKAKREMKVAKEDLKKAKIIRKNRTEYDILAKSIVKLPERNALTTQMLEMKNTLDSLENEEDKLDQRMEMYKKHFKILVPALHQLELLLEGENEKTVNMDVDSDEDDAIFAEDITVPSVTPETKINDDVLILED